MKIMIVLIIYLALLALMGLTHKTKYFMYTKTLCSLAFIITAALGGPVGLGLVPGLIGFALGDFLIVYKKSDLRFALTAFGVGNICLLIFMNNYQAIALGEFILPVIMMIIITIIDHQQLINFKQYRTSIYIYAFILTLSLTKSINLAHYYASALFMMILGGYILYFISDLLLVPIYFKRKHHALTGFFAVSFYYIGIMMIAIAPLMYAS